VEAHRDFVAGETLATAVELAAPGAPGFAGEAGDGEQVTVTVARATP
jgi:isoleucyl-tRNA synthetase